MTQTATGSAEAAEEADEDGTEETIEVYGATARRQRTVDSATMSLVVGTGALPNGSTVLVPYVEFEVATTFGDDDDERTETIARTLSFDNAAFLLEELSTGLAELMDPIRSLSQGEVKMPPYRVAYSLECVSNAIAELAKVEKALKELPKADPGAGSPPQEA